MNLLLSQLLSGAWNSLKGVCVSMCANTVSLNRSVNSASWSFTLITVFFVCVFFFSSFRNLTVLMAQTHTLPNSLLKTNNKTGSRYQWQRWEPGCHLCWDCLTNLPLPACASSPAAPLTLNYLAAVTTNQSNYRSRTVCSCSYCTASCISFEMYEVYILSLLFI